MQILAASVLGMMAGISGTVLGGWLVCYLRESRTQQSWLLGMSGGIMAAVVLFDLWPEAVHHGSWSGALIGTLLGVLLICNFEPLMNLLPWYRRKKFSPLVKLGLLLGVGIGSHNFPEGVALGTTFAVSSYVWEWLGLAVLMAVHNIPEGMVMASAFKLGKVKRRKIFISLFAVEIPMAIGGGVGAWLGGISGEMVAVSLGFAGGAMLLLVGKELLPLAKRLAGFFWVSCGFGGGLLLGLLLVRFI